ncbi:MAG: DUF1428 domain-containing protein [Pseudomonadota bacterium]
MYIDIFIATVPTDKRDVYRDYAEVAATVFVRHGAAGYRECWGAEVHEGELTSFPKSVALKDGETVVVGWALWSSKDARDAGMPSVMADPEMQAMMAKAPLDHQRMIFGGFESLVER